MSGKGSLQSAATIANAANAAAPTSTTSTSTATAASPTSTAEADAKKKKKKTAATTPASSSSSTPTSANAAVSSSSSTNTAAPPAANAANTAASSSSSISSSKSSRSVSFSNNTKKNNGPKAPPAASPIPVVAAAANAVVNAKGRELCFIYSNALTKDTFKKGCILVYKGDNSSPDHSAKLLEQLLAQKDLQVVKGGLQNTFMHPVDDKISLFIAYVEVTTMPTDEQIKAMKATISQALPKKGGKRFHTKKRHAKKRTTRRS